MSQPFDITTAPREELESDLSDSELDVYYCKLALTVNVTRYGGPNHDQASVQERLDSNLKMIEIIRAELARRDKAENHE